MRHRGSQSRREQPVPLAGAVRWLRPRWYVFGRILHDFNDKRVALTQMAVTGKHKLANTMAVTHLLELFHQGIYSQIDPWRSQTC